MSYIRIYNIWASVTIQKSAPETSGTVEDVRRDYGEPRFQALGEIDGRLHMLVFTPRGGDVHVISLRKANRREIKRYEEEKEIPRE